MLERLTELRALARGMWNYRWPAFWTTLGVGLLGAVVTLLIPQRYEAAARVYVDTQSILKPLMMGLAVQPNVEQQVAMMGRTLISRPNVERVLRMADLDLKFADPQERDRAVDRLMRDIEFKPVQGANNLYTIVFRDQRQMSAKSVVQSLLSIFVESNLRDKRTDSESARKFLDEQIKTYEQRLQQAESALKDFKIQNMNTMPNLGQDYVTRVNDLSSKLTAAKLELREYETAISTLRRQIGAEEAQQRESLRKMINAEASSSPIKVPVVDERLEAQEKLLDSLQSKFTDEHPDVIGAKRVIAELKEQRRREVEKARKELSSEGGLRNRMDRDGNRVLERMRMDLSDAEAKASSLRARVGEFDSRLAETKQNAATVPKVEADYVQLTRDYDVNKKNYEQLLARREAAQISTDMEQNSGVAEFRIVDPPRVTPRPVFPNRPLLLGLVLLLSLAAGAGMAFYRDQSMPTFTSARMLRKLTGLPLLGGVSLFPDPVTRARERRSLAAFSLGSAIYVMFFLAAIAFFTLRQYPVA